MALMHSKMIITMRFIIRPCQRKCQRGGEIESLIVEIVSRHKTLNKVLLSRLKYILSTFIMHYRYWCVWGFHLHLQTCLHSAHRAFKQHTMRYISVVLPTAEIMHTPITVHNLLQPFHIDNLPLWATEFSYIYFKFHSSVTAAYIDMADCWYYQIPVYFRFRVPH